MVSDEELAAFDAVEKAAMARGDATALREMYKSGQDVMIERAKRFLAQAIRLHLPDLGPFMGLVTLQRHLKVARAEHAALERRVAQLEQANVVRFAGVWREANVPYRRHDLAIHGGTLWHCNAETNSRPGTDETWQMCVKTR